ncbi:kynureninase [Streptomyces sp. NPDC055210]
MGRSTALTARAGELDAADVLAPLRERYALPPGTVYLAGNSLGPPTTGTCDVLLHATRTRWGGGLVRSWTEWMTLPAALGDRIGRLAGAAGGQVVLAESASVQIFNLLVAAARLRPGRRLLVTDPDHFPTDRFLADSAAELLGLEVVAVPPARLADALGAYGEDVAVVAYPAVDYRSAEVWDIGALTARAHEAGAVVLWDVSHALGALPLSLDEDGVDLAVGCTYKYLSGGPGSPAAVYVAHRHQDVLDQPLTGWLGHAAPFTVDGPYEPAPGAGRMLVGTPPVLSLLALRPALEVYDTVSMDRIRAKNIALGRFLLECAGERLAGLGFATASPHAAPRRGSHITLRHPAAYPLVRALERQGVVADMRDPDLIRFGLNALYVSYDDVRAAVECLREVTLTRAYDDPALSRAGAFG